MDPAQHPNWMRAVITCIHGGDRLGAVWSTNWCDSSALAHTLAHAEQPLWSLLLQCCSPLGRSYHRWDGEESTLRRTRTSSDMTSRASAPAPCDPKVVTATEHRNSPSSHQSDSCQHTLGEYVTHVHFRSSSPTKDTRHI